MLPDDEYEFSYDFELVRLEGIVLDLGLRIIELEHKIEELSKRLRTSAASIPVYTPSEKKAE